MKVPYLKTLLESLNNNDEVSVAITLNDRKSPIVTNDIGYSMGENGGLVLEVGLYDADFDY